MYWNRAHVGDVLESVDAFQNEVGNLALGILGIDLDSAKPSRRIARRVFLVEALALDAAGIARQHPRPIFEVGQYPGGDTLVVFNQVTLGVTFCWPEDLIRMRDWYEMLIVRGRSH